MRKLIAFLSILSAPTIAPAASICISPAGSAFSFTQTGNTNGNRGYWYNSISRGEAHCSKVPIISPDTTMDEFETYGNYCWCRVTQVAAPNGYLGDFDGAWVFRSNVSCASDCASHCADQGFGTVPMRRALLASPYVEF